jgi:hypothetical protein
MQIDIIDVGNVSTHSAKNGRQYQSVEITYKNPQGQAQTKKLMSFGAPEVFKIAQTWTKGDSINVATIKDNNGYWQWTKILAQGEADPSVSTNSASKAPVSRGSNYETSDERAKRQVMIVRQSSLSNAVATLAIQGSKATANDVITLAKLYEGFVLNNEADNPDIRDMNDDVPL